MTIYGVDPGKDGVVCAIHPIGGVRFHKLIWEDNYLDFEALQNFLDVTRVFGPSDKHAAFLERPLMASLNRSTQSIVNTGICYGRLSAVFEHAGIPVRELSPQEWQKTLGLKFAKGESKQAVEAWVLNTFKGQTSFHKPFTTKAKNLGARDALGIAMAGKKLLEAEDE